MRRTRTKVISVLLALVLLIALVPALETPAQAADYTISNGQTVRLSNIPAGSDVKIAGSATIQIDCNRTLRSINYTGTSNHASNVLTFTRLGSGILHISEDVVMPQITIDANGCSVYFEKNLYVQQTASGGPSNVGMMWLRSGEVHIWGNLQFGKAVEVYSPAYCTVGGGIWAYSYMNGTYYKQTGGTMLVTRGLDGGYDVIIEGGTLKTGTNASNHSDQGIEAMYYRQSGGEVTAVGNKYGLRCDYDAEISGGTLTATGTGSGSFGYWSQNYLKVTGGDFTATGTAAAMATKASVSATAADAFRLSSPVGILTPQGGQVRKMTLNTYYSSTDTFWTIANQAGTAAATTARIGPGCSVTFNLNGHGGSTPPASQFVASGGYATAPADPSESGWLFLGWYYYPDGSGVQFRFNQHTVTSDIVLYAKWSKQASAVYTVSYNTQGHGTAPGSSVVGAGGTITKPADPTAYGWIFGGWYKNPECTGSPYNFSTPVNSSFTLYAKWIHDCPSKNFTDVKESDWYHTYVDWAVRSGITGGTTATTFSPNATCTRAQTVMFLWAARGKPNPTMTESPFTDVKSSDWYYKAVLWAVENGITGGTTPTTFSPNATVTRGQVVTFLYAMRGKPAVSAGNPFSDVKSSDYFYKAVLFAVENGITGGTTSTTFSPNDGCTRAQIVTFIYRYVTGFAVG